ncbi:MAG: hypothetical protein MMC33_004263 [Icmadophila ericetorum]|nr:hypothetical protein [Icmadophila ericetorum]
MGSMEVPWMSMVRKAVMPMKTTGTSFHGPHGGALYERGQEGGDAHEEERERPVAAVRNLLVQQHEQRQREADRTPQPGPTYAGADFDQGIYGCEAISHPLQEGPEDDKQQAADDLQKMRSQTVLLTLQCHAHIPQVCEMAHPYTLRNSADVAHDHRATQRGAQARTYQQVHPEKDGVGKVHGLDVVHRVLGGAFPDPAGDEGSREHEDERVGDILQLLPTPASLQAFMHLACEPFVLVHGRADIGWRCTKACQ